MSGRKDFTMKDVAAHSTKKDIYVVIHDKVYDVSPFVDEHPYVLIPVSCLTSWLFGTPDSLPQWCLFVREFFPEL